MSSITYFLTHRLRRPAQRLAGGITGSDAYLTQRPLSPSPSCRPFAAKVELNVRHRTLSLRRRPERRSVSTERRGREARRIKMSDSPFSAAMDSFVSRENIKRYRKLVSELTSAAERSRILSLLTEEEAKFELEQSRDAPGRPSAGDGATGIRLEHNREEVRGGG